MSIFDSFTGAQQARDIRRGQTQQLGTLNTGYTNAQGQLTSGYNQALGYINPLLASGEGYRTMYDNLMGLNGAGARTQAQQTITSDPLWTGQLASGENAAMRALNARGLSGSGSALLAGQRVLAQQYGDTLNRYAQGAQQGQQASLAGAQLASDYGRGQSDLTYGNAQQQANVYGNTANAMAASRGTLWNNIIGAGSMLLTGMAPGKSGTSAFGNIGAGLGSIGSQIGQGWNQLWGAGAPQGYSSPVPGMVAPPGTYYPGSGAFF